MATRSEKLAMINAIATGEPNTALEIRNILTALIDPPSGTIVMKDVTNAYINSNFDGTGLGINEEIGYARVNGDNGTRNWEGRVPLSYDPINYPTMGTTGGEVNHTLTIPEIPIITPTVDQTAAGDSGGGKFVTGTGNEGGGSYGLQSFGGGLSHNNMQPYIVTLITMKL
jgi:hypothetical protein